MAEFAPPLDNLISLEGGDGSGKATQAELLRAYLANQLGMTVMEMSFPRYTKESGYWAGQYLDGQYGGVNDVHPDLGVMPYAIDRFDAGPEVRAKLALPRSIGVLDRYMGSNLAHQGAKIDDPDERHAFYDRTLNLEYGILRIPRPRINIVLLVPTAVAQANVDKKDASTRPYTTKTRDIHEADPNHLDRAKANYEELCELYPDEFTPVLSVDESGLMRTRESVQQEIRVILSDKGII